MSVTVALPRTIQIGGGTSAALAGLLETFGLSRPLLVTDRFLHDTGRVDTLLANSRGRLNARVFADTIPEPTVASIEAARAFLDQGQHDCVVGFGGGSPIDSAKAIAVLAVHGGDCRSYKAPHVQNIPGLPIFAVPTTAGTGSEVTRFTIITDEVTDEKMLCAGLAYLPTGALVDYEQTLTMPPRLTADTGIDALTHAIEAYVSRRANQFSDVHALSAMRLIAPHLRRAYRDPEDRQAREAMMIGSMHAGIAFSNASVALVHGMSRPIGGHFHVPHGLSNAMLLPAVTAFSAPGTPARYATCARTMGIARDHDSDQAAVLGLIEELRQINIDLEVPTPAAFGIDATKWHDLIPTMIEEALASGSPTNNPIIPTVNEMEAIYRRLWLPAA